MVSLSRLASAVLLRTRLFRFVDGLRRTKEDNIMRPVGLIIGHGYAKAVSGGRIARFPAAAALARETGYESAIGHGPAVLQLNDLGTWVVGEDALTFAPQRLVSILDRSRYTNPSFIALARQALVQVVPDPGSLSIMTGMPAAWYADRAAHAALEAAVRTAAAPWGEVVVRIAPGSTRDEHCCTVQYNMTSAYRHTAQGDAGRCPCTRRVAA
jgi:hypothetical protein